MDKIVHRKQDILKRKTLDLDLKKEWEAKIHAQVSSLLSSYDSIGIYLSMEFEVDTLGLLEVFKDKELFAPIIVDNQMQFHRLGNLLHRHRFGMLEPVYTQEVVPQVLIVPMIGFNPRKFRIGFGKGFYDRYLSTFKGKTIGLAFSMDAIDFREREWDRPLDIIITETGLV